MSHEDQIELRDRMILILSSALTKDPEQQRRLIRVAEAQATEEMNCPVYVMPSPEAA